ncbi:MAG: neutral zinc metallopeptidase [Sphingobium sp. 66-54]|nr:MAG: neutral zinc metallopeptidase [Sphingobium sp. 66-54]
MTSDPSTIRYAPDAAMLSALARRAIAVMPPLFRTHLEGIAVRIEEFADETILADLGIADPWELSGLYEGRPLTEQSLWDAGELAPTIRLFRRPLLDEWVETGVALEDLITHVIVHEVGHHFGFSDDDMDAIERDGGER